MRIFQFVKQVAPNTQQFEQKYAAVLEGLSYRELKELYLTDGFYSTHILKPILDFDWDNIGYTVWDYERLQKKWAAENGLVYKELKEILWAQIAAFKPDVIYNLQPFAFTTEEIKNIPNQPKKICWFAAPINDEMDFSAYSIRLTNLPADLEPSPQDQHKNVYFNPAVTTQMEEVATNKKRPIDVLFYGQYMGEYFKTRNTLMDQLMQYKVDADYNVKIHLLCKVKTKPYIDLPLIGRIRKLVFPPRIIHDHRDPPLFGASLYETIAKSKIVVNAAVDFSGQYKVNMRNFEATGCGALLLSDEGIYPEGFVEGETFATYTNYENLIQKIDYYLKAETEREQLATNGHAMIKQLYSKEKQWEQFQDICASIL